MSFITNGGSYEWKITNNLTTYGAENLSGGKLTDVLYKQIGIGNVIARTLTLTLWDATIDPSYPLVLKVEATDVNGNTTTIGKGTYYVDTIDKSPYSEYSNIIAYDALLKTEVPYMRTGTWAATTDRAVVEQIASDIGVSVSPDTLTLLTPAKTIDEVPSIGDNGTTSREMLSVVGCMRGGNFIINDDNELELVPLSGKYNAIKVVTVDSNGLYQYVAWGALDSTYDVLTLDGGGIFQKTNYDSLTGSSVVTYLDEDGIYHQDTWTNVQAIVPSPVPTVVIGDEVVQFDVAPTETIKRVEVWANGSTSYRSPSGLSESAWEALGGIILSANMPIMASQSLADELYTAYYNTTYVPYTADTAYFDPDTPLGTSLQIKNDTVLLTNRTLNIDVLAASDMSADATQAVVSYYPYLTPFERALKNESDNNVTRISINEEGIAQEVRRAEGAESDLGVLVQTTKDSILETFSDYVTGQEKYIRRSAQGLELGEQDSNFKALLSNTELAFTGADGQKAAWISNTQMNIEEAVIRKDEKFIGSSGNWVQQVVNDHFQIKWVGN